MEERTDWRHNVLHTRPRNGVDDPLGDAKRADAWFAERQDTAKWRRDHRPCGIPAKKWAVCFHGAHCHNAACCGAAIVARLEVVA